MLGYSSDTAALSDRCHKLRWGNYGARSICRMLGYSSDTALSDCCHKFGACTGQILLYEVSCTGSEASLSDCRYFDMDLHRCKHHGNAGVRCDP